MNLPDLFARAPSAYWFAFRTPRGHVALSHLRHPYAGVTVWLEKEAYSGPFVLGEGVELTYIGEREA